MTEGQVLNSTPISERGPQADFIASEYASVKQENVTPDHYSIKGMPEPSNLGLISDYHGLVSLPQPGSCPPRPSMWGCPFSLTWRRGPSNQPPKGYPRQQEWESSSQPCPFSSPGLHMSSVLQADPVSQAQPALFSEARPDPALWCVPAGLCDAVKPQLPPVASSHMAKEGPQARTC